MFGRRWWGGGKGSLPLEVVTFEGRLVPKGRGLGRRALLEGTVKPCLRPHSAELSASSGWKPALLVNFELVGFSFHPPGQVAGNMDTFQDSMGLRIMSTC